MSGSCGIESPYWSYKNKRAAKGEAYEPTYHEHWANVISHGVGIFPSIIAFYYMTQEAYRDLQYHLMILYGVFTTLLFISSSVYHYHELRFRHLGQKIKVRYYLHICDRAAIYLFIAASYTPWLCLRHCGFTGLNLKVLVWIFAILGILYQYNFHEKYKTLETIIYIFIATCPSIGVLTMNDRSGVDMMMYGGIVYLVGVIFFKMDGIIPFAHAIWHLFVLIGATIHTYAVYCFLLGPDINNPMPIL